VGLIALASCGGGAGGPLAELDWEGTGPLSGSVVEGAVEVRSTPTGGAFPLATIDAPAIAAAGYALEGEVRYAGVSGQAYLEMWSIFPDGSRYFSRTLDVAGLLAALEGDSEWRPFQLPFLLEGAPGGPSSLEVNVVLPGSGTVWVGPIRLVSLGGTGSESGAWWSDRAAGLAGGIGGAIVGILGGVLGWLAARGRARRFVLATMVAMGAIGVALLAAGLVALALSQPYSVTGTLFIAGVVLVVPFSVATRSTRAAYARAELRKMRALDATS
jgi:hypothetical protein